jgi:hypothetical protein
MDWKTIDSSSCVPRIDLSLASSFEEITLTEMEPVFDPQSMARWPPAHRLPLRTAGAYRMTFSFGVTSGMGCSGNANRADAGDEHGQASGQARDLGNLAL